MDLVWTLNVQPANLHKIFFRRKARHDINLVHIKNTHIFFEEQSTVSSIVFFELIFDRNIPTV